MRVEQQHTGCSQHRGSDGNADQRPDFVADAEHQLCADDADAVTIAVFGVISQRGGNVRDDRTVERSDDGPDPGGQHVGDVPARRRL
jgi:hypothetical protein